jgi:mannose-6-phosphate isomerase-like protein (cupin superfamily)
VSIDPRQEVRRVVTGHDARGKAVVLMDGASPTRTKRASTGTTARLMWIVDRVPAPYETADAALREPQLPPPRGGAVFRVVDFPPMTRGEGLLPDQLAREIGEPHAAADCAPPRHPFMHRTRSVDFAVVLSGEIEMLLDDSEVMLRAGDVVVQQGTSHAWVNRGTQTCRIAFVMLDAAEIGPEK